MAHAEAVSHHRRVAIGTSPATGPVTAAVPPQADQDLPSDETVEEREGPARTTVIVLDLDLDPSFPAVPRAHHSPKETIHHLGPALPCALAATLTDLIEIAMPAPSAAARIVTATVIVPVIVTTPADAAVQVVTTATPPRMIMMQSALARWKEMKPQIASSVAHPRREKRRKTADGHPDSSSPPKTHENTTNNADMLDN